MKKKTRIGEVSSLFLDSGAHTLYNREIYNRPEVMAKRLTDRYGYYRTKEFWAYVDDYAVFVKKYQDVIDYYANVDVIYHPELSWEVLKYLEEKHDLHPVPVIHWGADLKWFKRHLDAGYKFLGIGGLGQGATKAAYIGWADSVFSFLCPGPSNLPLVRTHGFAMTSYDLMLRYPWWSVDSATWTKVGAFGGILVPHRRGGKFVFTEQPYVAKVSHESPTAGEQGKHYLTMGPNEKRIIQLWLEEIGVPLGKMGKNGEVEEEGVITDHSHRRAACLLFFEKMRESLPEWPWPFRLKRLAGFSA